MKARSAALIAHQAQETTTRAWCWKVTRTDSQVFGFTSVDRDLVIGGVTYLAASGFMPSAIDGQADLSVPNLEAMGILNSSTLTEVDMLAGKWDGAAVEIFECNYADLTQGTMSLRSGTLGNVSTGAVSFKAEIRGLAQSLQQSIGELYSPACSTNLGHPTRCTVGLGPFTVTGAVTTATSSRAFTDSSRAEASDYFGAGLITWTGGLNSGASMEVRDFASGAFTLSLPMPSAIQVGDTYTAIAGCRKRAITDCKNKFSNIVNFQGFPYVPGNDKVLGLGALTHI